MRAKSEHRGPGGFAEEIRDLARDWGEEISGIALGVRHRVRAHRSRRVEQRELLKMNPRQLQDIGLTPGDLPAIFDGSYFRDASRHPRRTVRPRACVEKRA